MAEKYDDLARSILENVGGAENVASVAHCITRVRFKLKDESRANTAKIEALKGVIQVIQANGQYQVVVGNIVEDVYDAVLEAGGLSGSAGADDEPQGEKTVASVIIDLISGIFAPALAVAAAMGVAGWFLGRSVAQPVVALAARMKRLADGDRTTAIPGLARRDEIGRMAGALEVFRDAAIANDRLEAEAAAQRQAAEEERIRVEIDADLDTAQKQRLLEQIEQRCPLADNLAHGTRLVSRLA